MRQSMQIEEIITPLFLSLLLSAGPGSNRVVLLLPLQRGWGPLSNGGPFCIVITAPSYPDLIQG